MKGGDPLIFGRGGEELEALREAGVPCACIPGITAAQGAASSIEIPLTHRGLATGVRYVTGHRAADASLDLDWASLADGDTTLVVYMGAETIPAIARRLIEHGLATSTPVLAVTAATTPRERRRSDDAREHRARAKPARQRRPRAFHHRRGRPAGRWLRSCEGRQKIWIRSMRWLQLSAFAAPVAAGALLAVPVTAAGDRRSSAWSFRIVAPATD